MTIRTTLAGDDAMRQMLHRLGDELTSRVLARTAEDVELQVREGAEAHSKSGALVRSLRMTKDGDQFVIQHDPQVAPHAVFVHWGTKPHIIRPKKKTSLRWAAGSKFAFAKFVRHPGYKGDAWMDRAAQEAPKIFAAHVAQAINNAGA